MLNLMEIVFYKTKLFYETAFDCRTLDGYKSVLSVSDRLHLQGTFFSHTSAMAAPAANLIATTDVGDQVQEKTNEGAGQAQKFHLRYGRSG